MIDRAPILVADDNSDDLDLLRRACQEAGLSNPICCVSDGEEAIRVLQEGSDTAVANWPLLLILDLDMPRCTGFAVLKWLREHPELQSLPTIILTNSAKPADMDQSRQLGAHGYWVKPSSFQDLVALMAKLKSTLMTVIQRLELETTQPMAA